MTEIQRGGIEKQIAHPFKGSSSSVVQSATFCYLLCLASGI